jgi:hypothetical protein
MIRTNDKVRGLRKQVKPSGNGAAGGHASVRGAPLEPARPTGRGRAAGRRRGAEPHDGDPDGRSFSVGQERRNPRASWRPFASPSPGRRISARLTTSETRTTRRWPTDPAGRPPRAHWSRRFAASRSGRFVAGRGVLWTGFEPATARVSTWCSTIELPRPGPAPVPIPCTEHARATIPRGMGQARRGPDGTSRLLEKSCRGPIPRRAAARDAGGSRTHLNRFAAGRPSVRLQRRAFRLDSRRCPRQEASLVLDLRTVACIPHTPRT